MYEKIDFYYPNNSAVVIGRMRTISTLFESIARQPEASESLISATEMLYYDYTELLPISDEAIARQPGIDSLFNLASLKYLNFDY